MTKIQCKTEDQGNETWLYLLVCCTFYKLLPENAWIGKLQMRLEHCYNSL